MRRVRWILVAGLALILLVGCTSPGQPDSQGETQEDGILYVRDAQEYVELRIEDGVPEIRFLQAGFDSQIETEDENGQPIYFPIAGFEEKVTDATIGVISALHVGYDEAGIELPVAVFLMESGNLEWAVCDPQTLSNQVEYGGEAQLFSNGAIPWLEQISTLAVEKLPEGTGEETTIYATDGSVQRFNLAHPLRSLNFIYPSWVSYLEKGWDLYFEFAPDNELYLTWKHENIGDYYYQGTYDIELREDAPKGMRPGTLHISVDLQKDEYPPHTDIPQRISGAYEVDSEEGQMILSRMKGDYLAIEPYMESEQYIFGMQNFEGDYYAGELVGASNEELIAFLQEYIPEVESMFAGGMKAIVPGSDTWMEGEGFCRDVWIGTDHTEHFVKEAQFTVSEYGSVYWYDPEGDAWIFIENPFAVG